MAGIQWLYLHTDEIHPEDLAKEYVRVEPFVSLDYVETTLREEYDGREKRLLGRIIDLERKLDGILAQPSAPSLRLSEREDPNA